MTTTRRTRPRPPLHLPRETPVTVLHVCADNDRNGNPRRCFVVIDQHGRHVETIDEGYSGEGALYGRWPWFHSSIAGRLNLRPSYPTRINVAPAEYKRLMRRDTDERAQPLRDRADRYQARYDTFGEPRSS